MNSILRCLFVAILFCALSCQRLDLDIETSPHACFLDANKSFSEKIIEYGRICLDVLCSRAFEGRKVGTLGCEKAFSFLLSEVSQMGYAPEVQQFQTENGVDIRSIIVTIPGTVDSTIIVGAHFDGAKQSMGSSHYSAANDNGSGTVTLLILLKDLYEDALDTEKTIRIILWGSEEVFEKVPFRASTHYCQTLSQEEKMRTILYINVDTMGHQFNDEHKMLLEFSSERRVRIEAEKTKSRERFNYVLRERLTGMYSDFASFYNVGIPYLNFHDYCVPSCPHPVHSLTDTPEFISIEQLYGVSQEIRDIIKTY